ncbi:substrate-binding domain-containing protein, partial [Rhizobium ruizarguesonis]
ISVDYRAPETFDMVSMGHLIDAAFNQKPDGLIVSIPDASALGPSIKKAVAAGIPVISITSGSGDVDRAPEGGGSADSIDQHQPPFRSRSR